MNYLSNNLKLTSQKVKRIVKRDILKAPIINYFSDNHTKNVLISYITKPFKKGINLSHTNSAEALEIAQVFRSFSFNVDIADFDYEGHIDYQNYSVIFGFGEPLVKSFNFNPKKNIKRIYYGTGMHVVVQNHNTLRRIENVKDKIGLWIPESGRIVEKIWTEQTTIVDSMILLGNEEVKKSYQKYFNKDIYLLQPSFYNLLDYKAIISKKNFSKAKNNYLWFGSGGLIHKGLDLLLEIFKELPDLHLHICGPIENEQVFRKAYYKELYKTANIHTYGFVKIDSFLFREILEKCAFIIYPTCSEGGSPSVLNVSGNGGFIPILTKEASIDIEGFGLNISDFNYSSVLQAINDSRCLTEEQLIVLSEKAGKNISGYTLQNYKKQLKTHLHSILSK